MLRSVHTHPNTFRASSKQPGVDNAMPEKLGSRHYERVLNMLEARRQWWAVGQGSGCGGGILG